MIKLYQTVEDFVADESFQNFVLKANPLDVKKWETYSQQNPLKQEVIDDSKFFVKLLSPQKEVAPPKKSYKKHIYWLGLVLCISILGYVFYSLSLKANIQEAKKITQSAIENNISIVLPDKSTLILRKGSQVVYQENWDHAEVRKVALKGEAYFDVEKDSKPFEVILQNGKIEVLGTKFLARTSAKDGLIFLEEGMVSCFFDGRDINIGPGDVLRFKGNKFSVEHKLDIRNYDSWRETKLSFKNASIHEIVETINNSYDLEVVLGSARLKNRKITATVDENDPLLLLDAIAAIYDIEIIKESNKLILK